jgi:hypothetical protein
MNFYWVYSIPTWLLFVSLIGLFGVLSVIGLHTIRPWSDKALGICGDDNNVVSEYMGMTGIFFSLVLGMVAIGAWDAYGTAAATADAEASAMATLYRSADLMPAAVGNPLAAEIRSYARTVIDQEWVEQQSGIIPAAGDAVITRIGQLIYALPADTAKQEIMASATVDRYYELVAARRHRIEAVNSTKLPGSLWWVVLASNFIILSMSMLMHMPNRKLDIAINIMMSVLTGSILSFIIAMDNPFRGEISVPAASYELIYQRLMAKA